MEVRTPKFRIACNDCLEWMSDLADNGEQVDMVLADLPYEVTQNPWDQIIPFKDLWPLYEKIVKPNGAMVFTGRQPFTSQLIMSKPEWFKFTMVWRKNLKSGNLNARKRPMVSFEDIIIFYREQPTYNPQRIPRTFQQKSGNKRNSKTNNYGKQKEYYLDRQSDWLMPDDVIDAEDNFSIVDTIEEIKINPPMLYVNAVHNSAGKIHPTQKPIRLMEWLIKSFTNENDIVLDNTMGSATTGIAAIKNNREFWGCEKDSEIFKIAQERINNYIEAVEADKQVFSI